MSNLRRNRQADALISKGNTDQRVARGSIRVSYVGGRGKANAEGKVEAEFYSPALQNEACAQYFKNHGIEYDSETSANLADLDRRARQENSWLKREGLLQHIADAKAGKFTDIGFYKVSRLARNPSDAYAIVEQFLDCGVTVHFVRDSLPPLDSTYGKAMLGFAATISQMDSDNLADNLSDAIAQRWKRGKHMGLLIPGAKR